MITNASWLLISRAFAKDESVHNRNLAVFIYSGTYLNPRFFVLHVVYDLFYHFILHLTRFTLTWCYQLDQRAHIWPAINRNIFSQCLPACERLLRSRYIRAYYFCLVKTWCIVLSLHYGHTVEWDWFVSYYSTFLWLQPSGESSSNSMKPFIASISEWPTWSAIRPSKRIRSYKDGIILAEWFPTLKYIESPDGEINQPTYICDDLVGVFYQPYRTECGLLIVYVAF